MKKCFLYCFAMSFFIFFGCTTEETKKVVNPDLYQLTATGTPAPGSINLDKDMSDTIIPTDFSFNVEVSNAWTGEVIDVSNSEMTWVCDKDEFRSGLSFTGTSATITVNKTGTFTVRAVFNHNGSAFRSNPLTYTTTSY